MKKRLSIILVGLLSVTPTYIFADETTTETLTDKINATSTSLIKTIAEKVDVTPETTEKTIAVLEQVIDSVANKIDSAPESLNKL